MPILKGLPKLNKTLELLQTLSGELRETLEEKRGWLEEKPESYQESEAGEAWAEHLDAVEAMLDEIDNIESIEGYE